MKPHHHITVDELAAFMNRGWPGEDWYPQVENEALWERAFHHEITGELYTPCEPGRVVDLADFDGQALWQGYGADPTGGRGHRLSELFLNWKRKQVDAVVVAFVPKDRVAEVAAWLESAGCLLAAPPPRPAGGTTRVIGRVAAPFTGAFARAGVKPAATERPLN